MLGVGVMIHDLTSEDANLSKYYGRTISHASIGDALRLTFSDGTGIIISDEGQSCCENRYISCDDPVQSLVGGKLTKIEVKGGPDYNGPDECNEQAFVEIATDKGFITLVTHNEHNGYYGGFAIQVKEV